MSGMKEEIISIAKEMGIDKIGFTTRERLEDAPPSGDLGYALPSARSAISLCVAYDRSAIRPWLSKQDFWTLDHHRKWSYAKLKWVARRIQDVLEGRGYEAVVPLGNSQWRKGELFGAARPVLSHMYVAVASGIGWFGWSGMVLTAEYGAPTALLSVVTSAELEADPLAEVAEGFCEGCHLCAAVCPTRYIAKNEEDTVTLSTRTYTRNKKRADFRCQVGCNGLTGVNTPDDKWSTWSHKVLDFGGCDDDEAFKKRLTAYAEDPDHPNVKGVFETYAKGGITTWEEYDRRMIRFAPEPCGNCQLICWPDMKDRQENYRLLTTSGRIHDGPLKGNRDLNLSRTQRLGSR